MPMVARTRARVPAFSDGPGGVLSSIGASPFANHQTAPRWVEISRDGRHLFTVNTAVPSISSYRIHRDGTLRLIGNTPFAGADASTLAPEDARPAPTAPPCGSSTARRTRSAVSPCAAGG